MRKNVVEVRHLGITIKITRERATRFIIPDYTSGHRVRHVRLTETEARDKAKEVCEILAKGKQDERALMADAGLKYEVRRAMEALEPTGKRLLPAALLFVEAVSILGTADELIRACEYWKQNRPDKPFKPKQTAEAIPEFLLRQTHLSPRRQRTLKSYLGQFKQQFEAHLLHQVKTNDLEEMIEGKKWSPKTHNDFLGTVGLVYKYAQSGNRNWIPSGYNPAKDVERLSIKGTDIGVFEPWELRQMFARIDLELIPFLVLWNFSGCRKEEAARISWPQIEAAMKTGEIEVLANQTKARHGRRVPMLQNARAWLTWWLNRYGRGRTGLVLPARWNSMTNLDDLPKYISRNTGITWKSNGCRHSYITYRCKITGNVVDVADECGNSPAKIERHYRKKSVPLDVAKEWFAIMPPTEENIVPMPTPQKASAQVGQCSAEDNAAQPSQSKASGGPDSPALVN